MHCFVVSPPIKEHTRSVCTRLFMYQVVGMYGPCIYIIEKLRFRTQTAANKNKTREYSILIVDSSILHDRDRSNILGSELRIITAFLFFFTCSSCGRAFVVLYLTTRLTLKFPCLKYYIKSIVLTVIVYVVIL